jgi:hypothetical protein
MKNHKLHCLFALALSACALSFLICGCSDRKSGPLSGFSPISEVPFDISMGKSETQYKIISTNSDDASRYAKAKALYEKNLPSKVAVNRNTRIPKIIHQIWLGPNLPPSYFVEFQERLKFLHPDWEYHLWNETDLEELKLDNWDIVEKSSNWAEKSDVIRCDLLDRFGGVYMDVDMDMRHSLNELHEKYDFYAGMEPPHGIATTQNRVWVGISIMASRPGHPIMKNWKRRIRNCWDDVDLRFSSPAEKVINHTFFNFTHAVMQEVDQPGNVDMLFPATYFYPIVAHQAAKRRSNIRSFRERFYDILENLNLKKSRAFSKIYPETIGVHYWGSTWQPGLDQQVKEVQRILDGSRKEMFKLQNKVRLLEKQLQNNDLKIASLVSKQDPKMDGQAVSTIRETHTAMGSDL